MEVRSRRGKDHRRECKRGLQSEEVGGRQRKVAVWSAKMLEEVANRQDYEDTEERRQRRHIRQEGTNELWKELCGKMEEEVLEKYKVEEGKEDAYKGRGEPLKMADCQEGKERPTQEVERKLLV